ncbi:MAG: DUF1850 domain-containing protein [Proteobacteria bacterium]|nr:DUF1850 domain-containing protein [Pseudomonadota bacterium]
MTLVLVLAMAFALWPSKLYLRLIAAETGAVVLEFPVKADSEFTISHIHSVQKTPVYEHFKVLPNGDVELEWMKFQMQGSGLPDPPLVPGKFEIHDNWMYLKDIGTVFRQLSQRVGAVADHKFTIQERTYDLPSVVSPGTLLVIKTETDSGLKTLIIGRK